MIGIFSHHLSFLPHGHAQSMTSTAISISISKRQRQSWKRFISSFKSSKLLYEIHVYIKHICSKKWTWPTFSFICFRSLKKLVTSLPRVVFNCTCLLELSEEFRKLNLVSTQWCAAIFNYWLSGVVMGGSGRFGSQHGPAPAPTTSSLIPSDPTRSESESRRIKPSKSVSRRAPIK